jgi:hypothetical protein
MCKLGPKSAFKVLRQAARDVGWPEAYSDDLNVHDRARLHGDDAPTVFGWVLRRSGTELLDPRMSNGSLCAYLQHYRSEGAQHLYMWFDGTALHSLSFDHWSVMMRQENEQREEREPNRSAY